MVVIEDTGVTEDRPTSTQPLDLAMIRAIPSYLATHPAVLCSINSPLCPQDIMNAPPLGGGG